MRKYVVKAKLDIIFKKLFADPKNEDILKRLFRIYLTFLCRISKRLK